MLASLHTEFGIQPLYADKPRKSKEKPRERAQMQILPRRWEPVRPREKREAPLLVLVHLSPGHSKFFTVKVPCSLLSPFFELSNRSLFHVTRVLARTRTSALRSY